MYLIIFFAHTRPIPFPTALLVPLVLQIASRNHADPILSVILPWSVYGSLAPPSLVSYCKRYDTDCGAKYLT